MIPTDRRSGVDTEPTPLRRGAAGASFLGTLLRLKAVALLIAALLAAPLAWFAADRLGFAAWDQGVDLSRLPEPARSLLLRPLLAPIPALCALALAIVAVLLRRGHAARALLAVAALLCLLIQVGLLVAALVQFMGPMYEYSAL